MSGEQALQAAPAEDVIAKTQPGNPPEIASAAPPGSLEAKDHTRITNGDGIAGNASPEKELPAAPLSATSQDVPLTGESTHPPQPPPKAAGDSPSLPAKPVIAPSRPIGSRLESQASLQDVELSRGPSPLRESIQATRSSHPASTSVTSLHSVTSSSAQSPSRPTSTRPWAPDHSRRSSTATTLSLTSAALGRTPNSPQLSSVIIMPPLQVLVQSKEAKKSPSFLAAAQKALDLCQGGEASSNAAYLHPREIFEPLRLAISNPQTTSVPILITSLDLLSKLISHSFFSEPNGPPKGLSPLPDLITHTITLAYSESSPPQVALQVVKALMAIVLSTDKGMLVHQSSLLKAVRTVYNVFLLSNDAANQVVAQGGLTQMVHHVFGRVIRPDAKAGAVYRRSTVGENEARRLDRSRSGTPVENGSGSRGLSRAQTPGAEPNGVPKLTL